MPIEFHFIANPKLDSPILIEGFPGLGLVGTISASYLVEKLNMEPLGYMTGEHFPPLAAIHNKKPLYPARMYFSKKYNLFVFISEFVIPIAAVNELSEKIYDFAKKNRVKQIISLGGIAIRGEQDTVYAISSVPEISSRLEKIKTVELIKEGATTGVTGVLLAKGAVENYPVISLLAESQDNYMDPKASAMVLEVLKEILNIELDTSVLEKEAARIDNKVKEIVNRAKNARAAYKKVENESGLGTMYG